MVMTTVGIADLKARLSEFLARARAGDEVLVTDRGRPVARLVPIEGSGPGQEPDPALSELERAGAIRLSRQAIPERFWLEERPSDSTGATRAGLLDERRSGR